MTIDSGMLAYQNQALKVPRAQPAQGLGAGSAAVRGGKTIDRSSKLYEQCREFESIFVNMMLKEMRATVHKGELMNGGDILTLQRVLGHTGIKHVVVASMGDLLGFPKGLIVNFVVRTMRKMVPAWSLPGHVKFNDALKAGVGAGCNEARRYCP